MSHHYSGPDWGFPRGDLTHLYTFPKPGDAGKSILVMNVHPSAHDYLDRENPLGATTAEERPRTRKVAGAARRAPPGSNPRPWVRPNQRAVPQANYFAPPRQSWAGRRTDPFFFDRRGAVNNLQFTGDDFFADKDVCSIVSRSGPMAISSPSPIPGPPHNG
jgi:hypothetical protein